MAESLTRSWSARVSSSLALLLLVSFVAGQPKFKAEEPITSSKCNLDLIKSFGLKGLTEPSTYRMEMCPDIELSCCRVSDQLVIFDNWEINYERTELEERLLTFSSLYEDILTIAEDVEVRAEFMMSKLKRNRFSNCRILATKVVEYRIKKVAVKLRENIEEMNNFLLNSYKGFYCSLCDANKQQAFNVSSGEVNLNRKFCRQMTSKSFQFLIYFHVHMVKYLNLLMRFLTYCDGKGRFSNTAIDPDRLMIIQPKMQVMLEGCREYRNRPEWFESCRPICQSFNILRFPQIYLPQFLKYKQTAEYLRKLIHKFDLPPVDTEEDLESEADPGFKMTPHKKTIDRGRQGKSKSRNVAPGDKTITVNETLAEKPMYQTKAMFGSDFIIKSESIVSLNLESFSNKFVSKRQNGMNVYEIGKQTQMTHDKFDIIKKLTRNEFITRKGASIDVKYPLLDELPNQGRNRPGLKAKDAGQVKALSPPRKTQLIASAAAQIVPALFSFAFAIIAL